MLDAAAPERADIAELLAEARVAAVCAAPDAAAAVQTALATLGSTFRGVEDTATGTSSSDSDLAVLVRGEAAPDSPLALFAALVAAAQTSDAAQDAAQDAVLARTALHVAALGPRTAHVLGRTPGVFGALAGVARRSTALPVVADTVRALALCTAASPDNKDLLGRADILGVVEHLFALPDSAQLLRTLLAEEEEGEGDSKDSNSQQEQEQQQRGLASCIEALRDLLAGNEAMQRAFGTRYGLAETLLAYIEHAPPALQAVCAGALGALCELRDNADALAHSGGVARLAHVLARPETATETTTAILAALTAASRASSAVAAAVAAPECAPVLDRAMAVAPAPPALQQAAVDLLAVLVKSPDSVVPTAAFLVRVPTIVAEAQKEQEQEQEQEEQKGEGSTSTSTSTSTSSTVVRRNAAAVIGIVAEARVDAALPLEPCACAVLAWAQQDADEELRATALWLLGNVARTEGLVADLVERRGAVALLCRVLAAETRRADIADHPRVVAAALGLLRNLAVGRTTRDALAAGGVLDAVVAALPRAGCRNQHVLFDGVVLLSTLVRGSAARARRLAAVPGALAVVTQIARGVAFAPPGSDPAQPAPVVVCVGPHGEKDLRVQYEAARLLAALCAEPACARALAATGVAQDLRLLVDAPYDVLRAEGRAALDALDALGLSSDEAGATAAAATAAEAAATAATATEGAQQ